MSEILPWLFLLLVLIAVMCLGGYLIASAIIVFRGAPFVPMSKAQLIEILTAVPPVSGQCMADLGSGDGRLVHAYAAAGVLATGCELNPFLVLWSRLVARLRQLDRALFVRQNLFDFSCRGCDLVFLYAFPSMMDRLQIKLQAELKPGATVVCLSFPFNNWSPAARQGKLYIYKTDAPITNNSSPLTT